MAASVSSEDETGDEHVFFSHCSNMFILRLVFRAPKPHQQQQNNGGSTLPSPMTFDTLCSALDPLLLSGIPD
ncbi:hypothetical protein TYRP_006615 [Tyrophagus putrescentiae]|nr:hypothetical protein TYRP_006615 [Tyrophagus putrescentiae]